MTGDKHLQNSLEASTTPRWYLLPGLIVLVCLAFFFSASTQKLDRERDTLKRLTQEVSILNARDGAVSEGFAHWLVQVKRLLPMMLVYDTGSTVAEPLQDLTAKLTNAQVINPADQLALRRELVNTEVALRQTERHLNDASVRRSLIYYFCLGGFFLLLGAALVRSPRASSIFPMQQILSDRYLFSNAPVGLCLSDHANRVVRVNRSYEKLTGYSADELIGAAGFEREPDGMLAVLREKGRWTGEQTIRCKDGSTIAEKVTRISIGDCEHPEGYLTISMDPVVSKDEQQLMLWQAHHDSLTKLPNANLLHERLVRALTTAQVDHRLGALISIDLDGFQQVNDSVGHEAADRVLTDAAYRIAMCARESDTVARTGSDHFMVVMLEIEDVSHAEKLARAAIESIALPFHTGEKEIFLTASAGVTIFPEDGLDHGELMQKANAARLQAKRWGGDQVAFFEAEMNNVAARRLEIETHLRRAIDNKELELHYQPIIDCQSERVYGAEALLRWHSEALGFVSPAEFIPVAEQSGLIVEIGEWVVHQVGSQLACWRARSDWPDLRVSLNVSARQFVTEAHAHSLLAVLGSYATESITVELTESALIAHDPGTSIFINGLQEHGLRLALDDFGTGYSSIGYLKDFDFDVIKIDKSFIDGIASAKEMGVIASIIAMGRILGMEIVAEGVEDAEQVASLNRVGCDYIQGYFYSKPLPVAAFEDFVCTRMTAQV